MDEGRLILVAGALLALGILASLVAGRLRIPGLVLFLGVGMAVGSDGLGLVQFDDYELARTIGIIALALILFEGGLAAGLPEIRPVLGSAITEEADRGHEEEPRNCCPLLPLRHSVRPVEVQHPARRPM